MSLDQVKILKNTTKIKNMLRQIKREGVEELIEYLETNNFFTQASSTKYHHPFRGGNAYHALEVFEALDEMNYKLNLGIPHESVMITALLHDICKSDNYIELEDGTFTWNPESLPGHGFKSANLVNSFINLSIEEYNAIAFHMGAYEKKEFNWGQLSNAYKSDKLSFYLHVADMRSTYGF